MRQVRSFVRRQGRLTQGQARALTELLPRHQLPQAGQLDLDAAFGRHAPRVLEIGYGNGEALLCQALAHPEFDFIGVEVYPPGIGHLLQALARHEIANVRVSCIDAVSFLGQQVASAGLNRINIYFPDPWPKKRHHKRRLINTEFARLAVSRLQVGGLLHIATDWADYAEQIRQVLLAQPELQNMGADDGYAPRPPERPLTKFERRGQMLGHGVWDLLFRRRA
jgi:tRNA (guanine-N7-)-methyltransferase